MPSFFTRISLDSEKPTKVIVEPIETPPKEYPGETAEEKGSGFWFIYSFFLFLLFFHLKLSLLLCAWVYVNIDTVQATFLLQRSWLLWRESALCSKKADSDGKKQTRGFKRWGLNICLRSLKLSNKMVWEGKRIQKYFYFVWFAYIFMYLNIYLCKSQCWCVCVILWLHKIF